jgi:hypothetical protein
MDDQSTPPETNGPLRPSRAGRVWRLRTVAAVAITTVALSGAGGAALAVAGDGGSTGGPGGRGGFGPPGRMTGQPQGRHPRMNGVPGQLPPATVPGNAPTSRRRPG